MSTRPYVRMAKTGLLLTAFAIEDMVKRSDL